MVKKQAVVVAKSKDEQVAKQPTKGEDEHVAKPPTADGFYDAGGVEN
jgi:hypothetical protein